MGTRGGAVATCSWSLPTARCVPRPMLTFRRVSRGTSVCSCMYVGLRMHVRRPGRAMGGVQRRACRVSCVAFRVSAFGARTTGCGVRDVGDGRWQLRALSWDASLLVFGWRSARRVRASSVLHRAGRLKARSSPSPSDVDEVSRIETRRGPTAIVRAGE